MSKGMLDTAPSYGGDYTKAETSNEKSATTTRIGYPSRIAAFLHFQPVGSAAAIPRLIAQR